MESEQNQGAVKITVPEDLYDSENCDEIVEKTTDALKNGANSIVLDFVTCQSISSFGLRQLLKCAELAQAQNSRLSLQNVRAEIKDMLSALLFYDFLKVES